MVILETYDKTFGNKIFFANADLVKRLEKQLEIRSTTLEVEIEAHFFNDIKELEYYINNKKCEIHPIALVENWVNRLEDKEAK